MIHFQQIKIFKKKELELLLLKIILAKRYMACQINYTKYPQKGQRSLQMIQVIWETEIKVINKEKHFIITLLKMEINLIKLYLTIWETHFLWAINKKYHSLFLWKINQILIYFRTIYHKLIKNSIEANPLHLITIKLLKKIK